MSNILNSNEPRVAEVGFPEMIGLILSGKLYIVAFVAIAIIASTVYLKLADPIYSADTLIQIEESGSALTGLSELTQSLPGDSSIAAEIEIVKSRSVLGSVVDRLGLTTEIEPAADFFKALSSSFGAPQVHGSAENIEKKISVARLKMSGPTGGEREFEVSVQDNRTYRLLIEGVEYSKPLAFNRLERIDAGSGKGPVELHLQSSGLVGGERFVLRFIPRMLAIENLRSRLIVTEVGRDTGLMRVRLEGSGREQLETVVSSIANAYVRQNVERRSAEAQKSLTFLDSQLPKVRADLESAENKLARFRENNRTIDLSIETESVLEELVKIEQQLSELDLRRTELRRNYTPDHPLLQTVNEQREQLVQEKDLLERKTDNLPEVQQDLLRNVREVEVATELYTYLLNKTQELRVLEAGTVGNVWILDEASATIYPVKPRKKMLYLGSMISAIVIAVVVVLARSLLRGGISDPDEIERQVGSPVYAVLPLSAERRPSRNGTERLITSSKPDSIISEAFRSLRTSMHFGLNEKDGLAPVIVISGPAPNVGKTFVAANLAFTLAEGGKRVLFVDSDLRRGDSASKFELDRMPGLSEVLSDEMGSPNIQEYNLSSNLHFISRGKSPSNPAELIMNGRLGALMQDWRQRYDVILVDTPPVLAVTDPVLVSKYADAVFLVGRAGKTRMHEMVESGNRMARGGVSLRGVILNGMTERMSAGGQYGYGYGYYTYSYKTVQD